MWRRVDLVLTDVSEERILSIFRVEKSNFGSAYIYLLTLVPPKRRFTQDLHGATSQKTAFFSGNYVCRLTLQAITLYSVH
jgi:hypothetical protein